MCIAGLSLRDTAAPAECTSCFFLCETICPILPARCRSAVVNEGLLLCQQRGPSAQFQPYRKAAAKRAVHIQPRRFQFIVRHSFQQRAHPHSGRRRALQAPLLCIGTRSDSQPARPATKALQVIFMSAVIQRVDDRQHFLTSLVNNIYYICTICNQLFFTNPPV